MIQETKLKTKGKLSEIDGIKDFQIFELVRKNSNGGGLAIGINCTFTPFMVFECDDKTELLVVEASINEHNIQFITGYGPQESESINDREEFFAKLSEGVKKAELAGCSVFIELDTNSKLWADIIKGDPHDISKNGELLLNIYILSKLLN